MPIRRSNLDQLRKVEAHLASAWILSMGGGSVALNEAIGAVLKQARDELVVMKRDLSP